MKRSLNRVASLTFLLFLLGITPDAFAVDSELTRGTLVGLPGVYVVVEDLNPNVLQYEKYLKNVGLTKESLQRDTEWKLKQAGIRIFSREEWMKSTGRPVLCVTVNTHESEKYWFAYDDRIELRQIVFLESNPAIRTLAPTWSINMTGLANMGNLNVIKGDTMVLVNRFIEAYKMVNGK